MNAKPDTEIGTWRDAWLSLLDRHDSVNVDDELGEVLALLPTLTELRSRSGSRLGYFIPARSEELILFLNALLRCEPEELQRRKEADREGLTTEQLLERLRARETA